MADAIIDEVRDTEEARDTQADTKPGISGCGPAAGTQHVMWTVRRGVSLTDQPTESRIYATCGNYATALDTARAMRLTWYVHRDTGRERTVSERRVAGYAFHCRDPPSGSRAHRVETHSYAVVVQASDLAGRAAVLTFHA